MKLNLSTIQSMIIRNSETLNFLLSVGNSLYTSSDFCNSGITYDKKFTLEHNLRSFSLHLALKIGLLRKSWKVWDVVSISQNCFHLFILPCLEECGPVWACAPDSHAKLLDMNFRARSLFYSYS